MDTSYAPHQPSSNGATPRRKNDCEPSIIFEIVKLNHLIKQSFIAQAIPCSQKILISPAFGDLLFGSQADLYYCIMQFKAIEQSLNKLCSQHDEHMSLLDLADYLSNYKTLTQNNKHLNTKIIALQQSIKEMQEIRLEQRRQQTDQNQNKLQKFKKNIAIIQHKLNSFSSTFAQLDSNIQNIQKDSHKFTYFKDINAVNTNILQIIDREASAVQSSVAEYKNSLECKVLSEINLTKKICKEKPDESLSSNETTLQQMIENTLKDELEQYDKIAHQVSIIRLDFPLPEIQPFIEHNYNIIKSQISTLLSILSIHEDTISETDFNVIKQEYQTLYYRTKALKNYGVSELLKMYEEFISKLSVNKMEKQVRTMLRELQNRLQLLHGFMQKIEQQRSFIKSH